MFFKNKNTVEKRVDESNSIVKCFSIWEESAEELSYFNVTIDKHQGGTLKLTFAVDHSSTAVEGESTVSGVPKIKQEEIHIQVVISSVRCTI